MSRDKSGSNNPNWRGGTFINENGYRRVKVVTSTGRGSYRYEHRLIMESHLGRKLTTKEHVHHINGNKLDNRVENLLVMPIRDHAALHAAIAPARKCWVCEELGVEVKHYCKGLCKRHYDKYQDRLRRGWYKQNAQPNTD